MLVIGALFLAALLAAAAIYLVFTSGILNKSTANLTGTTLSQQPAAPTEVSVPPVNNSQDLESVSSTLDKTDVNQFDSALNQNTTDLNSF